MTIRYAVLVTVLALVGVAPASAQTSTTNCTASGNNLNCRSTTFPSAQEVQQAQEERNRQFQQSMANLGAALAQRRAEQAAQQQAWNAAATEAARQAATVARANYESTTAAMERFAADTASSRVPPVNADLVFDWSLVNGLEVSYVKEGENHVSWHTLTRWALTETPTGGAVLQNDATTKTLWKKQHMIDYVRTRRFNPASGTSIFTVEGRPLLATVEPSYESTLLVGTHAFSARAKVQGFDVTVPPGTLDVGMLGVAIAAIPGELPPKLRIWVVNERGEVVPADIQVIGRKKVSVPIGPANGTCDGVNGKKEPRDVVTLRVSIGTEFSTWEALAAAPHVVIAPEDNCLIVRR